MVTGMLPAKTGHALGQILDETKEARAIGFAGEMCAADRAAQTANAIANCRQRVVMIEIAHFRSFRRYGCRLGFGISAGHGVSLAKPVKEKFKFRGQRRMEPSL